jgi:hypothetical protein
MQPRQPDAQRVEADDRYRRNLADFISTVREMEDTISNSVEIGLRKARESKRQREEQQALE